MVNNEIHLFNEWRKILGWAGGRQIKLKDQIDYAKRRGVILEVAEVRGNRTFYRIREDLANQVEWKIVPSYPMLEASSEGNIRKIDTKRYYEGSINNMGYPVITLSNNGNKKILLVHRLVKEAFEPIENPNDFAVDHINGIRTDARPENLRWVSMQQNSRYRDENWVEILETNRQLIQKIGYEKLLKNLQKMLDNN